ncbi:MAG: hypothetical protein GY754_10845 [bacterium]|nr:hypothetical protein [bacterium]
MNKKRFFTATGLILLAGMVVFGGCRHKGPKHHLGKALERADDEVAELNLTSTQQAKYDEIRSSIEEDFAKGMDKKKAIGQLIQAELDKSTPDVNKIAAIAKKAHAEKPDYFTRYVDEFLEFYNLLDDTQKAQVVERARELHEKMKKHCGRH